MQTDISNLANSWVPFSFLGLIYHNVMYVLGTWFIIEYTKLNACYVNFLNMHIIHTKHYRGNRKMHTIVCS